MRINLKVGEFKYAGTFPGEIESIERETKTWMLGRFNPEWRATIKLPGGGWSFIYYVRKEIRGNETWLWLRED